MAKARAMKIYVKKWLDGLRNGSMEEGREWWWKGKCWNGHLL